MAVVLTRAKGSGLRAKTACFVLVMLAMASVACGDGDDTSPVTLTIVNASGETVDVFVDGSQSSLDTGDEDAITLSGSAEYSVLVTGESGGVLFTDGLTAGEIRAMDGRLVVSGVVVSPE